MALIYSDVREPFTGSIDFENLDAVKGYLRHFENLMYLTFLANSPNTSISEKAQARKELMICERKLKWWERLPRYDQRLALEGVEKIKAKWVK